MIAQLSFAGRGPGIRQLFVVAGLVLTALVGGTRSPIASAAPADTITVTAPTVANPAMVAEGQDYATQALGNPWDMNDAEDIDYRVNMTYGTFSNGIWSANTSDRSQFGGVFLQYQGWDNSLSYETEPDGIHYPIDSQRYTHLLVRLYTDKPDRMVAWFFKTRNFATTNNSPFVTTTPGWHIYDIDLNATSGSGTGTWTSGGPWNGLRLDSVFGSGNYNVNIKIDWARLVPATGPAVTITWDATTTANNRVELKLDTDTNAGNGVEMPINPTPIAASVGQYTWNAANLAPGTYYVRAELGDAASYSGPIVIQSAPVLDLTAPSTRSGQDYATNVLGHPWDLTSMSQFQYFVNLSNPTFGPGYLQLTSGGSNDPQMWFLNLDRAHAIDTSVYHYFNYDLYLADPNRPPNSEGQYSQWNAGARAAWSPGEPFDWQSTKVIIAWYNRTIHAAHDLRIAPRDSGAIGWAGHPTIFRFDPHEEDGALGSPYEPAFMRLGHVRLTADPTVKAGSATLISWTAVETKPTATVTLFYNTNRAPGGTQIAQVAYNNDGYIWTVPAGLASGNYWISAQAADGAGNTFSQVADVPLKVIGGQSGCPADPFNDVPTGSPFYTFITNLYCRHIVDGYPDGSFRPYSDASRGTLAEWVVRARGWSLNLTGAPHFTDVPSSDPLYPYVETAYNHSVLSGYNCGTMPTEPCDDSNRGYFRPSNNVTRGQMSKMVVNAMGWTVDTTGGPHFRDVDDHNPFYGQIETIFNRGLVSGYDCGGTCREFRWGNNNTRGQLSKVLSNSLLTDR